MLTTDYQKLRFLEIYTQREIEELCSHHNLLIPAFGDLLLISVVKIEDFIENKLNGVQHQEVIGEITLPLLRDEDLALAATYLLTEYSPSATEGDRSKWRCIYVSQSLSRTGFAQI